MKNLIEQVADDVAEEKIENITMRDIEKHLLLCYPMTGKELLGLDDGDIGSDNKLMPSFDKVTKTGKKTMEEIIREDGYYLMVFVSASSLDFLDDEDSLAFPLDITDDRSEDELKKIVADGQAPYTLTLVHFMRHSYELNIVENNDPEYMASLISMCHVINRNGGWKYPLESPDDIMRVGKLFVVEEIGGVIEELWNDDEI